VSLRDIDTETCSSKLGVGPKADNVALQNEILLRNLKKSKQDAVWQNPLSKAMAQKGCFSDGDDDVVNTASL
jgi:hypothetical protein